MLDFVPHMLLISVSVTGLMLTASSLWLGGYMYYFIALTHQALVIMTLFYLPFGKFFHVVQRPASVGVELYQRREREAAQATCPRRGTEFVGQMWLVMLVMVNVAQLWILAAMVEAALAGRHGELLPLVVASGACWLVSLSLILRWRPASRRHTSIGYIRERK